MQIHLPWLYISGVLVVGLLIGRFKVMIVLLVAGWVFVSWHDRSRSPDDDLAALAFVGFVIYSGAFIVGTVLGAALRHGLKLERVARQAERDRAAVASSRDRSGY